MLMRLAAIAAIAPATVAHAATTVVTSGSGIRGLQIMYYGPVGQSFTATDPNLQSIGFDFEVFNAGQPNAPVTLTLLNGDGLTGAPITSRTATVTNAPNDRIGAFFDFDLSGTTLTVGQQYTALLATTSSLLGIVYGPDINIYTGTALGGDAYTGGRIVSTRALDTPCINGGICDTNFRFTATSPAAVPEPASWGMLVGGFGLVGAAVRRENRARGDRLTSCEKVRRASAYKLDHYCTEMAELAKNCIVRCARQAWYSPR